MSIEEAVERFNEVYKKNRKPLDTKSNIYCGITNDIEERETAHNATFLITMRQIALKPHRIWSKHFMTRVMTQGRQLA